VKVPLRHVPAHYCTEVMQQLETMLDLGIITHSKVLGWLLQFSPSCINFLNTLLTGCGALYLQLSAVKPKEIT